MQSMASMTAEDKDPTGPISNLAQPPFLPNVDATTAAADVAAVVSVGRCCCEWSMRGIGLPTANRKVI